MLKKTLRLGVRAAALGTIAFSLAGCGWFGGDDLKSMLGMDKQAPDEFSVVTKAPLAIPPDFSLRPPQPGAPRPQEANAQPGAAARMALIGDDEDPNAATVAASPGQEQLLSQTGALKADPRIRQVINQETRALVEREDSFTDDILFWRSNTPPDEPQVDPVAESRRIQENADEGKPVTEGMPEPEPVDDGGSTAVAPSKEDSGGWFSDIF